MKLRIPQPLPAIGSLAVFALMALATTGCVPEFGQPVDECVDGAERLDADGCNSCMCDGGQWACTAMFCEPQCACPEIYAPVCGADGVTYGNACEAECVGAPVEAEGPCDDACPDADEPDVSYISDDPEMCALIDFACGGDARAFSDGCGCGCIANDPSVCGEGEVMHQNECKTLCGGFDGEDACPEGSACGGCAPDPHCPECDVCLLVCEPVPGPEPVCDGCPEIWAPVCGLDGVTYGNACEADCAGARVAYEGECAAPCGPDGEPQGDGPGDTPCEPEPCLCAQVWAPVCGLDGRSYGNPCEAECAGTLPGYEGECYQWCHDPEGEAPAADAQGDADEPAADAPGDALCDPPQPTCACPEVYAPVCGVDGRTFGNECAAGCAHVDVDYEGECAAPCGQGDGWEGEGEPADAPGCG